MYCRLELEVDKSKLEFNQHYIARYFIYLIIKIGLLCIGALHVSLRAISV
ncbi:MAG: hypothetical protein HC767_03755 [Akkermansiaceae bacterium]|nr:hypothetical protein [Akkermansiaceae bacterium]